MDAGQQNVCMICLQTPEQANIAKLSCGHVFCSKCFVDYINVLRRYKTLTPDKLKCLHDKCEAEISDELLVSLFPGEEGFILKTVKKCYKESKNPSVIIFHCNGFTNSNRKSLIDKPQNMSREQHSKLMNDLMRDIYDGKQNVQNKKSCTNILTFNRGIQSKDKYLQCYVCGVTYCLKCFQFNHTGLCPQIKKDHLFQIANKTNKTTNQQNFEEFLTNNKILRCLNAKCGLPIAKQEGCFWVKCRCSWQMCYPCQKLWGDCEHFSKYPYQKFIPPPEWMVKALNLY